MSTKTEMDVLKKPKVGHCWNQWLFTLIANIPVLNFALQTGWVSPMAPLLQSESSPLGEPASDAAIAWIASVVFVSAAISPPGYGYAADKFGRRTTCALSSVFHTTSWLMTLFAKDVKVLIASRVFSGIASAGAACVTPMYVKEISEDRLRGATGSFSMVAQGIGFVLIYALGAYLDYYTVIYSLIGLPFLHMFLTIFTPESPSYLVKVGRYEEALDNTAWLRGLSKEDESVKREIEKLKEECDVINKMDKLNIKTILSKKCWRNGVIVSLVLHAVRGLGGSTVVLSYASIMLARSGVTMDHLVLSMTIPAILLVAIIVSLMIIDRIGRKPLMIMGCGIIGVAMTVLGVVTHVAPDPGTWSWLPVTALVAAMFGYGIGVQSVPYIYITEIFNIQVRATLLGYIGVYIWVVLFINVQTFGYIESYWGIYTACYIYAAVNFVGVAYSLYCVPETKGSSVEEIERKLEK